MTVPRLSAARTRPPARARWLARTAVVATLGLATVAVAPGVATAATVGGPDASAPTDLGVVGAHATFELANGGASSSGTRNADTGPPFYDYTAWYQVTANETGPASLRATALTTGVDPTLEVWDQTSGALLAHANDVAGSTDPLVTFEVVTGGVYLIGLGSVSDTRGAARLTFNMRAVPSSPTGITATPGDGSVRLSWSPPAAPGGDLTAYRVVCAPQGSSASVCGTAGASATETVVTGLTNGVQYAFQVAAQNDLGWGSASGGVVATPQLPSSVAVRTEPASPVLGEDFDVIFTVTAGGAPVPDATVSVSVGGVPRSLGLVDGVVSTRMRVSSPATVNVALSYPGTAAIAPATATYTKAFSFTPQTITFPDLPASVPASAVSTPLAATASSGLPVTYEATGPCTLEGSAVVPTGYGTCTVVASQAGGGQYTAATSVSHSIAITPLPHTIGLAAVLPAAGTVGDQPVQLPRTSSAGRTVSYATPPTCAVDPTTKVLTFLEGGSCTVTATALGTARHEDVTETVTLAVNRMPAEVTVNVVAEMYGSFLVEVRGTAGGQPLPAGSLVTAVQTTTGGAPMFTAILDGNGRGRAVGLGTGPMSVTASYVGTAAIASTSTTFQVDLRNRQTIGLDAALPESATALTAIDLPRTTPARLAVVAQSTTPEVCQVDGSTLRLVGGGTCRVEASQAGDARMRPVSEVVSFTVVKRAHTVEVTGVPATTSGPSTRTIATRSSLERSVTVLVSGPACTLDGRTLQVVNVGECVVTATAAGDAATESASTTVRMVVSAAPPAAELAIRGAIGATAQGAGVWGRLDALRPGTAATMTVHSTPALIGQVVAGADGAADIVGALPALEPGNHLLVLEGTALDGSPVRSELAFGVGTSGHVAWIGQAPAGAPPVPAAPPAARPAPAGLPSTGSQVDAMVPLAVLLMVSGVGLVGFRRRFAVTASR